MRKFRNKPKMHISAYGCKKQNAISLIRIFLGSVNFIPPIISYIWLSSSTNACLIKGNGINPTAGDDIISRINRIMIPPPRRILYLLTNTVTLTLKPLGVLFSYVAIASVASSLIFLTSRSAAHLMSSIFYYYPPLYISTLRICEIPNLLQMMGEVTSQIPTTPKNTE